MRKTLLSQQGQVIKEFYRHSRRYWEKWGNERSDEEIEWAIDYLTKKSRHEIEYSINENKREFFLRYLLEIRKLNLQILDGLRNSWSVRKHRKKVAKKTYSFPLSQITRSRLKDISKGKGFMPLQDTIEMVIDHYHTVEKQLTSQLKERLSIELQKQERKQNNKLQRSADNRALKKIKSENELLKNENLKLKSEIYDLKNEITDLQFKIKINDLINGKK